MSQTDAKDLARKLFKCPVDCTMVNYEAEVALLAAALAACAREAAKDEFTWAIDALKDMGHLDIAFKLLARIAALERAAGERASLDPQCGQHKS